MTLATVPRYDGARVSTVGERAVVVGGSVAGLLAGRVLADAYREVTVLERDSLAGGAAARRGVPQSPHVHVLLEAGRATLEDLFPGFGEAVITSGGLVVDLASDLRYFDGGDFLARGPTRLPMYCASRLLFERTIRDLLAGIDGVTLRTGCRVTDYVTGDDGGSVEGVAFEDGTGTGRTLDADLVVDATGRTSHTPTWLDRHGYESPPVDEVRVDLAYSTVAVERPPGDRRAYLVAPSPSAPRGGTVVPVEDDRWLVTVFGLHGDHPPTDERGVREFAARLPTPEVGEVLDAHAWRSPEVHHYPFPSTLRRRYEALDRFPGGLVVTGDALASFNPIYGQGMSVAALDALQLHHTLAGGDADTLAADFFDRAADVLDTVWLTAVGADFQFPETEGPKPRGTDLFDRYLSRLIRRAHDDPHLSDALARVLRLERPPTALLSPGVVWRVLAPAAAVRRR
ncbi:MAG: NAD(P)/FAD-dependent oxidoreductase [Haloferacaceae archaeon]